MLKIGVIGADTAGEIHLDHWKQVNDIDIIGFYEPDDDIAKNISEKYQLPRFLHADMLIDSCDAVDITVPPANRFEWSEKSIKKGKHVFVISPMSDSINEARQLVNLVEESGIKFQVQISGRFNPAITSLKKILTNPLFIEIQHFSSINKKNDENNFIQNWLIHDIDLVLSIVKSDVKNIAASSVTVIGDDPDMINTRIEFHNGSAANLTLSNVSLKNCRQVKVFQKDVYFEIDMSDRKAELIKLKEPGDPDVFAIDLKTPIRYKNSCYR